MPLRKPKLLPRAVTARRRLSLRERVWVYEWAFWTLVCSASAAAGVLCITLLPGVQAGVGSTLSFVVAAISFLAATATGLRQLDEDRQAPSERRQRVLADRPRRCREHRGDAGWRELQDAHNQYAVEARRVGTGMEFRVVRYEPPDCGPIRRYFIPWRRDTVRWDAASEKWSVTDKVLRVEDPQTNLLLEAYCEAAEAARALEAEEAYQATRRLALDGIALAFTPPSRKTTDPRQLEVIRERVQSQRLLDAPLMHDE